MIIQRVDVWLCIAMACLWRLLASRTKQKLPSRNVPTISEGVNFVQVQAIRGLRIRQCEYNYVSSRRQLKVDGKLWCVPIVLHVSYQILPTRFDQFHDQTTATISWRSVIKEFQLVFYHKDCTSLLFKGRRQKGSFMSARSFKLSSWCGVGSKIAWGFFYLRRNES